MARKTLASLEARIAELEAANAALEARLALAREVFVNQRAHVRELEAALNARGAQKVVREPAAPVVTRFVRRDGVTCERVRTGNRAVIREVRAEVPGIEVREMPAAHVAAFEAVL